MRIPTSTYRIQFNKDFTFDHLAGIIDYLGELRVSTIYAAPILKSTKGSVHGYDVTDPHVIDPEIGTLEELKAISVKLKRKGMSWLQDIVPNHMAFDPSNGRLMDILERGPLSNYYNYFDINWNHHSPDLKGKLLVPFLGDDLASCISNKQIRLNFTPGGFVIEYLDTRYPVSISAYEYLFSILNTSAGKKLKHEWEQFLNGAAPKADLKTWQKIKSQWISAISRTEENSIRKILVETETDADKLHTLLEEQYYVLSHWKRANTEINYRRFFTVNQLICLRMEDDAVFNEYHSFLYTLYKENIIQGFRIDHIDGLNDPGAYIQRLRNLFGDSCYIIAEKILEAKETMPSGWSLQGTSGYEFLAYVNQLFTDRKGAKQLLEFYNTLVPQQPSYKQLVVENKKMMLENYMSGEWGNLVEYFFDLKLNNNFEITNLRQALGAFMISLPVYRIYPEDLPPSGEELVVMAQAFYKAKEIAPGVVAELDHLHALLVSPLQEQKQNFLSFLKRLMQFTGPLTAKGVEDTTFYIYNPLISHDEVGDSPSTLGISIKEFQSRMVARRLSTPLSLNATSTHDTKRGEDVRIRLNVLSEIPDDWTKLVRQWFEMNERWTTIVTNKRAPSVNDEYFIYQSVIGGFPEDLKPSESWRSRLKEYLVKVVREAKVNSSWEAPDEGYENACSKFVDHILEDQNGFLSGVLSMIKILFPYANTNALGQVLIKITAPGIPDIYQGCELWDLSYVDPDNRRPVDYNIRKAHLARIIEKEKDGPAVLFSFLADHRNLGIEKLFVTWKALNFRNLNPELFAAGEYLPLQVSGKEAVVCAYARHYQDQWVLVIIPLASARKQEWTDESVLLPSNLSGLWTNIFTNSQVHLIESLALRETLNEFPLGFFTNSNNQTVSSPREHEN